MYETRTEPRLLRSDAGPQLVRRASRQDVWAVKQVDLSALLGDRDEVLRTRNGDAVRVAAGLTILAFNPKHVAK